MRAAERDLARNKRDGFGVFVRASGGSEAHFPGISCYRSPIDFLEFNAAYIEGPEATEPIESCSNSLAIGSFLPPAWARRGGSVRPDCPIRFEGDSSKEVGNP
jgi:hypothetical protein